MSELRRVADTTYTPTPHSLRGGGGQALHTDHHNPYVALVWVCTVQARPSTHTNAQLTRARAVRVRMGSG